MISRRSVNHLLAQLVANGTIPPRQLLRPDAAASQRQVVTAIIRTFAQSASVKQKVTGPNNQQLISIARNISFRKCQKGDRLVSNSISKAFNNLSTTATSPAPHFIGADLGSSIILDREEEEHESTIDVWRRKAKEAVAKRGSSEYYNQSFNTTHSVVSERRLVVLLSWLEAQEKHIEKYRKFYLERGFDVLNVKTSPLDLLLPLHGTLKIAKDFVRFMTEKEYSNVVLHGFSVGGFMFGQILLELDRLDQETRNRTLESFRGIIFDSLVPFEGTCVGVARSITQNKLAAKILENLLELYLVVGKNIATKHYEEASRKVWGVPLKSTPTLFLMSKDDPISDHRIVQCLEGVWRRAGVETHTRLFDSSPHVQLFMKHQRDYVDSVEGFLRGIKML